ncbi:flippase-like domain-containing protein [bacterium]|nr:flippase-like domain-containing protein [bacterium]
MAERRQAARWAIRCIGFVIFGYLLYRIGPENLWRAVSAVRPGFFLAALPVFFVMIWVKAIKMRALMTSRLDLQDLYRMNAFAFSVGSLTPGRLGEFSKIVFLTRAGVSTSEAFSVTFIDRLSDLAGMMACAVAGLFVFFGPAAGWTALGVTIAGGAVLAALWKSDRMLLKIVRGKWRDLIEQEGRNIRAYMCGWTPLAWFAALVLTGAYLGLYFLQMWILVRGLALPVDYAQTAMAISSAALPAILPISVGNIGPRDAVLAAIFSNMGWGAESGVALSTLILALFITNGIFGMLFLPRRGRP